MPPEVYCRKCGEDEFQSSSGPKAGCHPVEGVTADEVLKVSILIRPEGRMPLLQRRRRTKIPKFQSSSGPKAGCHLRVRCSITASPCFNPHPARRPDATMIANALQAGHTCFNPHPARRPDATNSKHRPGFSAIRFNPHPARRPDATQRNGRHARLNLFQSSSGPKAGCHARSQIYQWARSWFQSSSGPKAGCHNSAVTSSTLRYCFNPHPARRPDATRAIKFFAAMYISFQSSSGPKAGCHPLSRPPPAPR